jgi:hypothetical protein
VFFERNLVLLRERTTEIKPLNIFHTRPSASDIQDRPVVPGLFGEDPLQTFEHFVVLRVTRRMGVELDETFEAGATAKDVEQGCAVLHLGRSLPIEELPELDV